MSTFKGPFPSPPGFGGMGEAGGGRCSHQPGESGVLLNRKGGRISRSISSPPPFWSIKWGRREGSVPPSTGRVRCPLQPGESGVPFNRTSPVYPSTGESGVPFNRKGDRFSCSIFPSPILVYKMGAGGRGSVPPSTGRVRCPLQPDESGVPFNRKGGRIFVFQFPYT